MRHLGKFLFVVVCAVAFFGMGATALTIYSFMCLTVSGKGTAYAGFISMLTVPLGGMIGVSIGALLYWRVKGDLWAYQSSRFLAWVTLLISLYLTIGSFTDVASLVLVAPAVIAPLVLLLALGQKKGTLRS